MSLENTLQSNVLDYLNSLPECVAENVSGNASQSGRPDINGCIRGRAFRIELKIPDDRNKATKKQNLSLRRWARAGSIVAVAYSLEFVQSLFDKHGVRIKPSHNTYTVEERNGCYSWAVVPKVRKGLL